MAARRRKAGNRARAAESPQAPGSSAPQEPAAGSEAGSTQESSASEEEAKTTADATEGETEEGSESSASEEEAKTTADATEGETEDEDEPPGEPMEGLVPGRMVYFHCPFASCERPAVIIDVTDPVAGVIDIQRFGKPRETRGQGGGVEFFGSVRFAERDEDDGSIPRAHWSWPR